MFSKKVSIIIPCHNEELNIALMINGFRQFYNDYILEILVVDDNSTDKTAQIVETMIKEDKRIRLISRLPPNGVGRALRDGLKEAKGKYILITDADFQYIIPEMKNLFDEIAKGADVAIGSRFSQSSKVVNYPSIKFICNRLFHLLVNLLLTILSIKRVRDISNNLKLFKRKVVDNLILESNDFAVNIETGLKPILTGFKVSEVPVSWIGREKNMGQSSFNIWKVGWSYLRIFLKLATIK